MSLNKYLIESINNTICQNKSIIYQIELLNKNNIYCNNLINEFNKYKTQIEMLKSLMNYNTEQLKLNNLLFLCIFVMQIIIFFK
jgi:hypothetical protein